MSEKFSPIGGYWEDLRKELLTREELEKSKRIVAQIGRQIEERERCNAAQRPWIKQIVAKPVI